MTTEELLKRVRRIEIKTRALTSGVFAGEYHSAFKGRGMAFAEVREYQVGDDVRDIDWNVTARTGRPHIKVYEEERELCVMLLIDVSRSQDFGTQQRSMRDLTTEIAATLAFSAIQNNDKIGVIFFSDHIEKFIPPGKGRRHILRIVREMIDYKPESGRTDIGVALEYLMHVMNKHCIAFVLSDFLDRGDYSRAMRIAAHKHELVAVRVYDRRMAELPNVGLLKVTDAETGHSTYIDTASRRVRETQRRWWQEETDRVQSLFQRCGMRFTDVPTDGDYVIALRHLFK